MTFHPNLVAWYRQQGDANDSSSYGNNGSLIGSPSFVDGVIGDAVSLNGSTQWEDIPDAAHLDITGGLTIMVRVKPNAAGTYLVTKHWGAATGADPLIANYAVMIEAATKASFTFSNTAGFDGLAGTFNNFRYCRCGTSAPSLSEWHTIAMSATLPYIYSTIEVLIDGVFYDKDHDMAFVNAAGATNNSDLASIATTANTMQIGARTLSTGTIQKLDGAIDEVQIYNFKASRSDLLKISSGLPPLYRS